MADTAALARGRWVSLVLAALLVAALYLPYVDNGFLYDDQAVILEPAPLSSAGDLGAVFARPYYPGLGYYRPVTLGSFLFQRAWVGEQARSFHLANVGLAVACLFAAYALLRLPRLQIRHAPALGAATLFVLHPVASSVVMPISGRDTLLATLLSLGAVAALCRPGRGSRALGVALFGLALCSKEMAVVVPGLLLLADLCGVSGSPPGRDPRAWLRRYGPLALVLLAYFAIRSQVLPAVGHAPGSPLRFGLSYLYGLQVALLPFRELYYEPRAEAWLSPVRLALVALALGATAWAVWRSPSSVRQRAAFFVGWFGLVQLPSANLVWQETAFAERYVFPAVLSVLGLAAAGSSARWDQPRVRRGCSVAGLALLAACIVVLPERGRSWQEEAFYRQWIRHDPQRVTAHFNFANVLRARGEVGEARDHYEEALRLDPRSIQIRNNLGRLLVGEGELDAALGHFESALRLDPRSPQSHNNAGGVWALRGRLDRAIDHFRRAVELDPGHTSARLNLARALLGSGQPGPAADELRRLLAVDPDHPEARALLERALGPS